MAEPLLDIDRIVREVIARLELAPDADKPTTASQAPGDGELVVSARVVTLSEVDGRLESVRRLVVTPQAVVTPAVRDELQRRNVTLAYASPAAGRAADPLRLVMVTAGKCIDPATLVRALSEEPMRVEPQALDCPIAAAGRLAAEVVRPDTLGLLLTRHPAAGLCLANRHAGVRAVSGRDAPAVLAAAADAGANLLVIDPAAGSFFQLKQIVTGFCRGGIRPCPEVFQQRLA